MRGQRRVVDQSLHPRGPAIRYGPRGRDAGRTDHLSKTRLDVRLLLGYCDNGGAADTTLPAVEVSVDDGIVYLTDNDVTFAHEGGIDEGDDEDDDDGPVSTSHIGF